VCKLKKAIYGLKQVQWIQSFFSLGFKKCQVDCNIYYLKNQESSYVFLALYIDDSLIFSKEIVVVERVKKSLSKEFEMKDF
jgi:hypothetical protein